MASGHNSTSSAPTGASGRDARIACLGRKQTNERTTATALPSISCARPFIFPIPASGIESAQLRAECALEPARISPPCGGRLCCSRPRPERKLTLGARPECEIGGSFSAGRCVPADLLLLWPRIAGPLECEPSRSLTSAGGRTFH